MDNIPLWIVIVSMDAFVIFGFYKEVSDFIKKKRIDEKRGENLLRENIEIELDEDELEMLNDLTNLNGNSNYKSYLREKIKEDVDWKLVSHQKEII